jgi:hypothetical protein
MNDHTEHKIGVDLERSPEFVKIFNDANATVDHFKNYHQKLTSFIFYKNPYRNRKRISILTEEYQREIAEPFYLWNEEINEFLYRSKYTVYAQDQTSHIVAAIQAMNAVSIRASQVDLLARDVKSDYYRLINTQNSIKMAWYTYWALGMSVFFGISGLILGLLSYAGGNIH